MKLAPYVVYTFFILGVLTACFRDACAVATAGDNAMEFAGKRVVCITDDFTIRIDGDISIRGDAKLANAIQSREKIETRILERFPPVFFVQFADGASSKYLSKRSHI